MQAVHMSVALERKFQSPIGLPSSRSWWRQPTSPGWVESNWAGLRGAPPTQALVPGPTSKRPTPGAEALVTGVPLARGDPPGSTWGRTDNRPMLLTLQVITRVNTVYP